MIHLRRLRTEHFCNLPDRWWDFGPGLQLVRGPNEAGKTALRRAVTLALYGDATSREKSIQALQGWKADGMRLELEFDHDGEIYHVARDFQQRKNSLQLPDGKQLHSKELVRAELTKMLLIPNERAFLATACMSHDELRIENPEEVQSLIERVICGTGEDVEKLIKAIEKAGGARHRGMDRPAKEPGISRRIKDDLARWNQQWAEAVQQLRDAGEAVAGLSECEQQLVEVETWLEQRRQHKQRHQELLRARKDCERLTVELVEIEEKLEQAADLSKQQESLEWELGGERPRLQSMEADVRSVETHARLSSELADAEAKALQRATQWDRVTVAMQRIEALRAEEEALPIRRDEVQNACLSLPGEIAGLEGALTQDRAAHDRRRQEWAGVEKELLQIRKGLEDVRQQRESLQEQLRQPLPFEKLQSLRTAIAELTRATVDDEVRLQVHPEQTLEVELSSDATRETKVHRALRACL